MRMLPVSPHLARLPVQCVECCSARSIHLCSVFTAVVACQEKAVFLLKFAGLSRVSQDEGEVGPDDTDGSPAAHPGWLRRSSQHWQKVSNAISTVGRLKQQVQQP